MRYFYFSQIADAKASSHFQKVKISSKINHLVKNDSFLADTIYASRSATDFRDTRYVISGATTVLDSLNVSGNTSQVVLVEDMMPAADGTISIIASPAVDNDNSYKFFYLGAVKVYFENSYLAPDPEITLIKPNGGEIWEVGKVPDHQ